jgi:predicted RNase H-like HicB family nuclease
MALGGLDRNVLLCTDRTGQVSWGNDPSSLKMVTYMSAVGGPQGVIAIGDSIEECCQDLIDVIERWIALRLRMGDTIPSQSLHSK